MYNSLWTTESYDPKILKKKFEENPGADCGYLYLVRPLSKPYPVGAKAEIEACQLVTWNKSSSWQEKKARIEQLARQFWKNELPGEVQDYLIKAGAEIVKLVKKILREDLFGKELDIIHI